MQDYLYIYKYIYTQINILHVSGQAHGISGGCRAWPGTGRACDSWARPWLPQWGRGPIQDHVRYIFVYVEVFMYAYIYIYRKLVTHIESWFSGAWPLWRSNLQRARLPASCGPCTPSFSAGRMEFGLLLRSGGDRPGFYSGHCGFLYIHF